ncbi:cubilin [Cloeon dipterum]|uniref:cubilin n=1 Tax=Cloeon dipterum TaxID=197152 RepID=UPI00321FF050
MAAPLLRLLLFGYFCVAVAKGQTLYEKQPRLRTQNGNLLIISGKDRNITLRTIGSQSFININGENLISLVAQAKSAVTTLQEGTIDSLQSSLKSLSSDLYSVGGVIQRTATLENGLTNLTTNVTRNRRIMVGRFGIMNNRVKKLERDLLLIKRNLRKNDCASNPCKNGGVCEDAFRKFYCRCIPGWEGPTCETDVNECARFVGTDLGCQNGATCVNKPGTYECLCPGGFYGLHCTQSSNNCTSASAIELCGHGTCIPQRLGGRGYTCLCDQGWKTNPLSGACTDDVNECETMTRPACSVSPAVPCVNTPGSFMCGACPAGFSGNGYFCSDIDECTTNNGGCSENPKVLCYNTMGSRMCGHCPPGFTGDGLTCTLSSSSPCGSNNGGCHPLARCYDNPNIGASFVQCICPPSYQGAGFGPLGCIRTGDNDSDVCRPNPCAHGRCYPSSTSYFECECHPGYKGYLCDTPILDGCNPNPCENGGTCVSRNGAYSCSCPSGFLGQQCQYLSSGCGGEINQDTGSITYSTKNEHFTAGINCLWHISVNESQVIVGTFSNFAVSLSPSCNADWVQIHDGKRPTSPSIGTYCGSALPPSNITSTTNAIVLWYNSPRASLQSSFEFRWTTKAPTCGGIFINQTLGTIKSPGFPAVYPANRECVWRISVRPGMRVRLHIFTLQLRQRSTNCERDFIEIKDGSGQMLQKICNNTGATSLTSIGPTMVIRFKSGEASGDEGKFEMTFSEITGVEGCGGTWTTERGVISSPNYPRVYPNRLHCEYLIQLPINERIKVTFADVKIETTENCNFDYLELRDGSSESSPLVSKICGTDIPAAFVSNGNELLFIFHTDQSKTERGFLIKYETACNQIFTAPSGIITSLNYPNNYSNSKECIYQIAQPLHKSIILEFLDFDIEAHQRCLHDSVTIRDGPSESSQFLGKFCGKKPPPITISTRNFLWIKFKTDATVVKKGFAANYTVVDTTCGGILVNPTGDINSQNTGDICTFVIHVEKSMVIRLTWRQIWSSDSNTNANCFNSDNAQIFDNSTSPAGMEIGRYCGNKLPPELVSQGNTVTIKLNQTMPDSSKFELSYASVKASDLCGGSYFTAAGTLTSPNYPRKYASNLDCIYIIQVADGQQISLNFTVFDLENSTDCSFDFIEIRNGQSNTSPLVGTFCGNNRPPPIIPSHSNSLWIRFHTDGTLQFKGFRALWDGASTGCGGILRSSSGHIESPNYPQPYGTNAECIWKIYVSKGNKINLWLVDFDMEKSDFSSGCYDYVEIRDGDALDGKVLKKQCTSNDFSGVIASNENSVTVIMATDASNAGRGFSLRYQSNCNNTLRGYRGVIESPNFPGDYPHNANCTWLIVAPPGNQINASFSHFALEQLGTECTVDFVKLMTVKVNDAGTEASEEIGKFCSTEEQPDPITTKYNMLRINFQTDLSVAYSGFRLEWVVHGCGGKFTTPFGTLQSPNYPNSYPHNTECKWEIEVEAGTSVELTINDLQMEQGADCTFDNLKVYGGPDENSPLLLHTCSKHARVLRVTTSGRYMTVTFKSDSSSNGKGFNAYYRQMPIGCGGSLQMNKGSFTSSNYPQNFYPNTICNWIINVDQYHTVRLTFDDFDVPKIGDNCDRQYVAVWEGYNTKNPPLLTHCGNTVPPEIRATGNLLYVRMVTNESLSKGFSATFHTACGATIQTATYGFIKSLNSREVQLGNSNDDNNCTWIITSTIPTSHVTLTITHLNIFRLETMNSSSECDMLHLDVHDGVGLQAPLAGRYCGKKIPPHIVSNGQSLTLNLVSEFFLQVQVEFAATYSVADTACGGTLTAEEGSFATPGYPGSYKLNAECIWRIAASPGNSLQLTFSMFDLESSEFCNNDYLEIRRGKSGEDRLLGVFCGSDLPRNLTLVNELWIKFRSDGSNVGAGFLAHYSLVHGGQLIGTSGQITNPLYPKYYAGSDIFKWRIIASSFKIIRLTFKEIFLNTMGCPITIYDGYDETAPQLLDICDQTVPPDSVISTSNVVYVTFSATPRMPGSMFMIQWTDWRRSASFATVTPGCGGAFNVSSNGSAEFTSPGFPYGYRNGLKCEWTFEAPVSYHTALYFNALDVEQSPTCSYDYVAVSSGSRYSDTWQNERKYCHPNATQVSGIHNSDRTRVSFLSDSAGNKTGFSATVFSVCGGNLQGPSGTLKLFNMTRSVPHGFLPVCEWNITVRPGRTIKVDIDQINTADVPGCPDDYLMLKNVKIGNSDPYFQKLFCGNLPPTDPIETLSNTLYVKFNVRKNYAQSGFSLSYQESSSICGGRYTFEEDGVNSLTISSPNHPNPPLTNTECEWVFIAPPGRRLRVDFTKVINMVYTRRCETAFVQFFNGGTSIAPSLGKYCKDQPSSLLTTDNSLYIRYQTTAAEPKNGFQVDVRVDDCGGTITSYDERAIEVPEKNDNSPHVCIWKVEAPEGTLISYSFNKFSVSTADENCSSDFVEVREVMRNPLAKSSKQNVTELSLSHPRFCGSNDNRTRNKWFNSATDQLLIILNSTRGIGKSADKYFKFVFRPLNQECGGALVAPEGEIVSPGYPSSQSRRQICSWTVQVPEGRRVKIEFLDFDLEGSQNACQQWLGIYNGLINLMSIGLYCGGENPGEISSSGNTVLIQSLTWQTSTHRGFKLKWSSDLPTVCEGDIKQASGSLTFPKANMSSIFCSWSRTNTQDQLAGTLSITVVNATMNRTQETTCLRSTRGILISADSHLNIAQICDKITTPKVITNPFPTTSIIAKQSDLANKLEFYMGYKFFECGGVLRGPIDNITSPAKMNMNCGWSLTYQYGQINVTFVNLNFTSDCSKQYLNVYNGRGSSHPKIGTYCKDKKAPASIMSQSNQLYVEYIGADSEQTGGTFFLQAMAVQKGCGGIYHLHTGLITSPNFPSTYPANSECNWEIVVDEGFHIGLKFVNRFFIELSANNCSKDYVEAFDFIDNDWKSLGKACGRAVPRPFNSTGNRMRVVFHSDNTTSGDGFAAIWNVNCGGLIRAKEGYISSPSYPSNYGKFLNCKYTILAPRKTITYSFLDFNLEQGFQDCRYDNVTIRRYTASRRLKRLTYVRGITRFMYRTETLTYCGQDLPPDGISSGSLTVSFQTDRWIEKRGFRLHYKLDDCDGSINETTILNPILYQSGLHAVTNCTWTITAPENKNVLFRFETFKVPKTQKCRGGAVKLFDARWQDRKKSIVQMCGNISDSQRVYISRGNEATLAYVASRPYAKANPFSVVISFTYGESVGCGGTINMINKSQSLIGSYSTKGISGNYENMLDCRWYVVASPGDSIKFAVNNFNVKDCANQSGNSTCNCDYLEVRDGTNQFSPILGRFCGSTRPPTLTSSGGSLYVRFVSDDYESDKGFQATITKSKSLCGPQELQVKETISELVSPGFGSADGYPPNVVCRWKLRYPTTLRFDIHIEQLDLESSVGCQNDKLVITEYTVPDEGENLVYAGNKPTAAPDLSIPGYMPRLFAHRGSTFCGNGSQMDWYSNSNAVDVIFSTNEAIGGRGFKLKYQLARCSRNFTRQYGRIHYQGRLHTTGFNNECSILISTEQNRTISLYFSELYSHKQSANCSESSIYKVYNGASTSADVLAEYCGVKVPNPVFSTGPSLLISVYQSDKWGEEGFDATYTTSDKGRGCGGILRSVAGSLTSPLYPGRTKTFSECLWEITVPDGSVVAIQFLAFNIGPRDTCNTDYLVIDEISRENGREVLRSKLCGNELPALFLANSNSIRLKYTTSIHNQGTGWKMHYVARQSSFDVNGVPSPPSN